MLEQFQHELTRMLDRFDASLNALLTLDPRAVAQTPAEVVYTDNKLRLLHYRPVVAQPTPVPLLVVPSVLTNASVLDLMPGNSLVEYLVRRGIDVYLLDWGTPGREDRFVTFDQYLTGYLRRVVQQVRTRTGQERISLLGYSLGGTFAAIFSALYGQYVRNLVSVAAPINFHDAGVLSLWTRPPRFNVDLVVDTLGTMPPALMQASFRMLKPTALILQQMALAERCGNLEAVQDYLVMQTWIADTTPWLGEAYRTYIKECYQANHLVQGKLVVGGQRVDLHDIHSALLTITAAKDQICPPQSAAVLNDIAASADKQVLESTGGHVGIIVGRSAAQQIWPQLGDWLVARSASSILEF
jgi:polyhydroxyalkanoate synthase